MDAYCGGRQNKPLGASDPIACLSNMRQTSPSMRMYENDNREQIVTLVFRRPEAMADTTPGGCGMRSELLS